MKHFRSLTPQITRQDSKSKIIWFTAILSFLHSLYFAVSTSKQPLLDLHSFRQAQTGLGAYWLGESSNWFQYQLPVLGYPWSIPFEFPTYQILAHYISAFSGISLIQTGRLLSYSFFVLMLLPIRMIIVDLRLPRLTFPIFCLFIFTSSNYLYWSRSFMIETTALFLTLSAIGLTLRFSIRPKLTTCTLALLFAICSGLTKSTTYLSFLLFVVMVLSNLILYQRRNIEKVRQIILGVFCILSISLLTTFSWIKYSDTVKSQNLNGNALTSTALRDWNYGTLEQRFSKAFWFDLIFQRTLLGNLGAGIGLIVLIIFLIVRFDSRSKLIVSASVVMFFLPLFVFTNLHIVHWYYQVSNQIYLFVALAIIFATWIEKFPRKLSNSAMALLMIIATLNFTVFQIKFSNYAEKEYTLQNSQILSLADFIKSNTATHEYILVYGQDWSSALAFAAERKTATLPSWMPLFEMSFQNPRNLFNGAAPSMIIDCQTHAEPLVEPTFETLMQLGNEIGLRKYAQIKNCKVVY